MAPVLKVQTTSTQPPFEVMRCKCQAAAIAKTITADAIPTTANVNTRGHSTLAADWLCTRRVSEWITRDENRVGATRLSEGSDAE